MTQKLYHARNKARKNETTRKLSYAKIKPHKK